MTLQGDIETPKDPLAGINSKDSTSNKMIDSIQTTTSYTLNIEILRAIALIGVFGVIFIGMILTNEYADMSPEESVIYKLFGFNHSCYYLDYHPARVVCALLIQALIIPMTLFVIGSYFRTRHAYQCGKVPKWLSMYNRITTIYNFFANLYFYMVFVNAPYDEHTRFIGHYLPYLAWKISQALLAIEQVCFMIYTGTRLPFGVPPAVAKLYAVFVVILTVAYGSVTFTVGIGHPIFLNPAKNTTHRSITRGIMNLYSLLVGVGQAILALIESRNGNLSVVTFSNVYENSL